MCRNRSGTQADLRPITGWTSRAGIWRIRAARSVTGYKDCLRRDGGGGGEKEANTPACCRNNFSRESHGYHDHSVLRQVLLLIAREVAPTALLTFRGFVLGVRGGIDFLAVYFGLVILSSGTAREWEAVGCCGGCSQKSRVDKQMRDSSEGISLAKLGCGTRVE